MSSYLLKITLRGTPNLVWRRFVVPSFTTLNRLHDVIQTVMGWKNVRSHAFYLRKQGYFPTAQQGNDGYPEEMFTLDDIVFRSGGKLKYVYDLEKDCWTHDIAVESTRYLNPAWPYPIYCLEGVRACPPETCGGSADFVELLHILGDPKQAGHAEMKKQYSSFRPDHFDLAKVNKVFKVSGPIPPTDLTLARFSLESQRRHSSDSMEKDLSLQRLGAIFKSKAAS